MNFRRIKVIIKIGLLILAIIATKLLDSRQSNFGEKFTKELIKKRGELILRDYSFEGELATSNFEIELSENPGITTESNIVELSKNIQSVYCSELSKLKDDIELPRLNVNIWAIKGSEYYIFLSYIASKSKCAK